MSSAPSNKAYTVWEKSDGSADFLQLTAPNGGVLGWIDPKGVGSGALASGGGGGVIPQFSSTNAVYNLPGTLGGTAGDNGTVAISGPGLNTSRFFGAGGVNLYVEGATVLSGIGTTSTAMYMAVNGSGPGDQSFIMDYHAGPSNSVTAMNWGVPGDAAAWQISPGFADRRLILGGASTNKLGFYGYGQNTTLGPTPDGVAQQTVTGSKDTNAALAALLTALAATGLIVDGTTGGTVSPAIVSLSGSADAINPHTSATYMVTTAGVDAMTIAAPTVTTDDGVTIKITTNTAAAHTLTGTGGILRTGTAAVTHANFASFAGSSIQIMAWQGHWYVMAQNLIASFT
jgi:hypothetical protein